MGDSLGDGVGLEVTGDLIGDGMGSEVTGEKLGEFEVTGDEPGFDVGLGDTGDSDTEVSTLQTLDSPK